MWLSGISGHRSSGLLSHWDNTMYVKSPWVRTGAHCHKLGPILICLRCCKDVNPQQPNQSCAEGHWFEPWLSKTNYAHNSYLLLSNNVYWLHEYNDVRHYTRVISIKIIWLSVISGHGTGGPIPRWDITHYNVVSGLSQVGTCPDMSLGVARSLRSN